MTTVQRSWNLDRVVIREVDGKILLRARNRGKIIEAEVRDRALTALLGEPTHVESEGTM